MSAQNFRNGIGYSVLGEHPAAEEVAVLIDSDLDDLEERIRDGEVAYVDSAPYENPKTWRQLEPPKNGTPSIEEMLSEDSDHIYDVSLVENENADSWGLNSGEASVEKFDFYARIEYRPSVGAEATQQFSQTLDTLTLSNYPGDYFRGVVKIGINSK